MNILEYSRYGAAGGDIGSGVMEQLPRGGHFAPFVEPELYAQELRDFFRPYRSTFG